MPEYHKRWLYERRDVMRLQRIRHTSQSHDCVEATPKTCIHTHTHIHTLQSYFIWRAQNTTNKRANRLLSTTYYYYFKEYVFCEVCRGFFFLQTNYCNKFYPTHDVVFENFWSFFFSIIQWKFVQVCKKKKKIQKMRETFNKFFNRLTMRFFHRLMKMISWKLTFIITA